MEKQHDNHVAWYKYRQVALADMAKRDAYEAELVRRYQAGLPLSRVDIKYARRLIREAREAT